MIDRHHTNPLIYYFDRPRHEEFWPEDYVLLKRSVHNLYHTQLRKSDEYQVLLQKLKKRNEQTIVDPNALDEIWHIFLQNHPKWNIYRWLTV